MHFPLFFGQRSQERYSGSAFYSSSPRCDSMRSLCLLSFELPGKFRFISIKADRDSSVEVPSSAGSAASNVSALFSKSLRKLKSGLDIPPSMPCRLPYLFDCYLAEWVPPFNGFLPAHNLHNLFSSLRVIDFQSQPIPEILV